MSTRQQTRADTMSSAGVHSASFCTPVPQLRASREAAAGHLIAEGPLQPGDHHVPPIWAGRGAAVHARLPKGRHLTCGHLRSPSSCCVSTPSLPARVCIFILLRLHHVQAQQARCSQQLALMLTIATVVKCSRLFSSCWSFSRSWYVRASDCDKAHER